SFRSTTMTTWLVGRRIGAGRPCAAARQRFSRGPSFTNASFTYRSSTSTGSPTSCAFMRAFATADRSVLSMASAARFFENWSRAYASPTLRPRIRSMTSRILRGLCRTYLLIARASMFALLGLGPLVRELAAVAPEEPRRRELAELVADHVFRDVHGNELVPVVHRERVPNEFRGDRRCTRPGLDDPLLAPGVHLPDLL